MCTPRRREFDFFVVLFVCTHNGISATCAHMLYALVRAYIGTMKCVAVWSKKQQWKQFEKRSKEMNGAEAEEKCEEKRDWKRNWMNDCISCGDYVLIVTQIHTPTPTHTHAQRTRVHVIFASFFACSPTLCALPSECILFIEAILSNSLARKPSIE